MESELSATREVSTCNSNATVVLNGAIFSLSSLTADSDKVDFTADKFDLPVSATGLISGPEGGLLVETSKGIVLSVGSDLSSVSLGNLGATGQVTLNSINPHPELHNTVQLLSQPDSSGQLFEVHSEGISTSSLDGASDGTALELPPNIILSPQQLVPLTEDRRPPLDRRKGGWPKGKKRKPQNESNAPKAPATGYVLFAIERRANIKKSNPELVFADVTKLLGSEWSSMSPEQKQKYILQAEADKKRYIAELKSYRQSDAYQKFIKRRKLKGLCDDDGIESSESSYINELDEEGLYCKVCNQYFSSLHNRKEHMFGKQHLLAITNEFEKDLQNESDSVPSALSQEVTSDADHSLAVGTSYTQADNLDCNTFIQQYLDKHYARELEIQELQKSLQTAKEQNDELVNKLQIYKDVETKMEQDHDNLKAYGAALATQIDALRMVPLLFGVVNF